MVDHVLYILLSFKQQVYFPKGDGYISQYKNIQAFCLTLVIKIFNSFQDSVPQ